jgi:hypothetical protein
MAIGLQNRRVPRRLPFPKCFTSFATGSNHLPPAASHANSQFLSDRDENRLSIVAPICCAQQHLLQDGQLLPHDPAEGIETRPAFREAFQRRRCLVPVDNFYQWKKTTTGKQPNAIALADHGLMALAGLWENWRSPAGEWVRSFAIVSRPRQTSCARSCIIGCRWF